MASALAQLTEKDPTERNSCSAMRHVQELVIECCSLLVIALMSNPSLYRDLQHCNFEDGKTSPNEQSPTPYYNIMVSTQILAFLQRLLGLSSLLVITNDICFVPMCCHCNLACNSPYCKPFLHFSGACSMFSSVSNLTSMQCCFTFRCTH